jgi:hypothetical protein
VDETEAARGDIGARNLGLLSGADVSDFRNPFGGGALACAVVFFVCVMVEIVTLLAD